MIKDTHILTIPKLKLVDESFDTSKRPVLVIEQKNVARVRITDFKYKPVVKPKKLSVKVFINNGLYIMENKFIAMNNYLGSMLPRGYGVSITPSDGVNDYELTIHDTEGVYLPIKFLAWVCTFSTLEDVGGSHVTLDLRRITPRDIRRLLTYIKNNPNCYTKKLYTSFIEYDEPVYEEDLYMQKLNGN